MFKRAAGRVIEANQDGRNDAWKPIIEFMRASKLGDNEKVARILETNPEIDVDAKDMLGNSPLTLAVKNDHVEVVGNLLNRVSTKTMREGLLLSISMDHDHISEIIIGHPSYQLPTDGGDSFETTLDIATSDTLFAAEISPLILAAQRNQFEVVEQLLAMGETIEEPHHPYCTCDKCHSASSAGDELKIARTRLNVYKGLTSDAYVTLSSADPIHRAFTLANKLKENAEVEKYYKADYKKLTKQLSDLTYKLLDKVRDGKELDTVLNEAENTPFQFQESRMARLKMAIRYEEKLFVAHPSCQKKLTHLWSMGDKYLPKNVLMQLLWCICFAVAYPVLAFIYCLWPTGPVVRLLETPVVKFIAGAISLFVFVILNFAFDYSKEPSSGHSLSEHGDIGPLFIWYNSTTPNPEVNDIFLRYHDIGVLPIVIIVYVLGYAWHLVKTLAKERIYFFTEDWYHIMDTAMLSLYVLAFVLHFNGVFKVREAIDHFSKKQSWIAQMNGSGTEGEDYLYWLDADRSSWDKWDFINLAEASWALANMLCLMRTTYIFSASELLGPLLISLKHMLENVLVFMVLFLVVMVAFVVGFHSLYWYYDEEIRVYAERNLQEITNAEQSYGKLLRNFRTGYFLLFGMVDSDSVEIGGNYDSMVTDAVGYALFGAYNWITIIVLLNMLIAMMARSYEFIEAEKDMEWKFDRSKLYLDYIEEGDTLCVPFNLLPTWWGIVRVVKQIVTWCCNWCCCCRRRQDKDSAPKLNIRGIIKGGLKGSPNDVGKTEENEKPRHVKSSQEYSKVIASVAQRFILHRTTKKEEEAPDSAAMITLLQRNLSNFRFDVLKGMARQDKGQASLLHNVTELELKLQETRKKLEEVNSSCDATAKTLRQEIKPKVTESKVNLMTVNENVLTLKKDVATHDQKINQALGSISEEGVIELEQNQPIMESLRDIQLRLQNIEKKSESAGGTLVRRGAPGQVVPASNDDDVVFVNNPRRLQGPPYVVSIAIDTNSDSKP